MNPLRLVVASAASRWDIGPGADATQILRLRDICVNLVAYL